MSRREYSNKSPSNVGEEHGWYGVPLSACPFTTTEARNAYIRYWFNGRDARQRYDEIHAEKAAEDATYARRVS